MSEPSPKEIAEATARVMRTRDRAARFLGIELQEIGPAHCVMSLTVREDHVQGLNVCHGGYIFSLADTCMAYASNSADTPNLAQSAQITFLAPGQLGDVLTATAKRVAEAGRNNLWDVEVVDQNGKQIAVFRGQTRAVRGKVTEMSS
jgi:acyl-CoA thioesterase